MDKYKTSNEWTKEHAKKYQQFSILDYDGWMNHKNGPCMFMTDLITQEDFTQRLVISTCMWKNIKKENKCQDIESNTTTKTTSTISK